MAKVRFIVKSNKDIVQLIVRVLVTRNQDFQKGTKIFIPIEYWNKEEKRLFTRKDKTHLKNHADFIKVINHCNTLLNLIENVVIENMSNTDNITPLIIEDEILRFHGLPTSNDLIKRKHETLKRNEEISKNKLLPYIKKYNILRSNDTSILDSTKQKYKYLENVIEQYQVVFDKELNIIECNKDFFQNFESFLSDHKRLMKSTIRRVIKNLKTVLYDARNNGIETNPQIHFSIKRHKEGDVVFLSFDELNLLNNLDINDETLSNTRDWLLIGCYTGQRISDFMRFNNNCIRKYKDKNEYEYELIEITQIKTKKRVTIPVHPIIKSIIDKHNGFPQLFSLNESSNSTLFNTNLKKLLKYAEINRMVYAKEFDEDEKRNYVKLIPLYKAASSHICRRSFASNYYGHPNFPTSLLISITGHKYESTFLEYIGKNDIAKALEIAKIFNS